VLGGLNVRRRRKRRRLLRVEDAGWPCVARRNPVGVASLTMLRAAYTRMITLGASLPDGGAHGPNEHHRLSAFRRGPTAYCQMSGRLANESPAALRAGAETAAARWAPRFRKMKRDAERRLGDDSTGVPGCRPRRRARRPPLARASSPGRRPRQPRTPPPRALPAPRRDRPRTARRAPAARGPGPGPGPPPA